MAGANTKQQKAQQKALEKQKQKIVEDKTFGLKNKKSKSVQKYIKSVQQQVTGQPPKDSDKYIAQQNKEKEEKNRILQQKALIASLFKTTETVKQASMDSQKLYEPKQSRMDQKIDIYMDQRIQRSKEDENMSNWDISTLEGVVQQKNTNACTTDIICKYFLQAVESKKYGWFWVCPNGGDDCKYRHCLPPGFVLSSDVPQEVEDDEETLEEKIERQRRELPPGGEMVTFETFTRWREEREKGRLDALKEKVSKDSSTQLTGKDLFTFNPNLFMDDEGAADDFDYDEDIDLEELIKENEYNLTKGNVLPSDAPRYSMESEVSDKLNDMDLRPDSQEQRLPESKEAAPRFNFGEKKKKRPVEQTESPKAEVIDGSGQVFVKGHVYPYEELLARIQSLINENNPDLSGSKRYTIKPPQVVRVGSKKVAWINFRDICSIMGRSMDHVHQFVLAELGTEGSIAGDGQLVLKGKYGPKNIESLLRKYITEYVTCSMCKSPNTTMERDCRARLFTQHCEACGANRSVNPIKNGFHALNRGERRKAKV